MKQNKDGKKVQNWHKPYNPKYKMGQRTHKVKSEGSFMKEEIHEYFEKFPVREYDEYWNSLWNPMASLTFFDRDARLDYFCCDNCYFNWIGLADAEEICEFGQDRLFETVTTPNNPVLSFGEAKFLKSRLKNDDVVGNGAKPSNEPLGNKRKLEAEVHQHARELNKLGIHNFDGLKENLSFHIGSHENIDNIQKRVGKDLARVLVFFAQFWVKEPKTVYDEIKEISFFKEVFTIYDSPDFLLDFYSINERAYLTNFKWVIWAIIIGQGGSLKKASSFFGWNIPAKFQHFLHKAPRDLQYPKLGCIYAEILRLGGNHTDFLRISSNESLTIDPTEKEPDDTFLIFWYNTLNWMIKHGNDMTNVESQIILSWAVHMFTESKRDSNTSFSWKGRGFVSTLNRAQHYFEEINRKDWNYYSWKSHGWNWQHEEVEQEVWSIEELTSSEELFEESLHMNHCVRTYGGRCISGTSSIFSLKLNDEIKITIEVEPRTRYIVQAYGKYNRSVESKEKEIIKLWDSMVLSRNYS